MIRPQSLPEKPFGSGQSPSGQFSLRLAGKTSLELNAGPVKTDRILIAHIMDWLWRHFNGEGQFKFVGKGQRNLAPIAVEVAHFFPQIVDDEY